MQARLTNSQHSTARRTSNHPRMTLKCVSNTSCKQCNSCSLNKLCLAKSVSSDGMAALSSITHHPKPMHKGEHLYRQDDCFESVYIVHSGAVKTYHLDESGNEQVTGLYLPGEMLGLDGLNAGKHKMSAAALNTTTLCVIAFKSLEKTLSQHPDLQRRMLEILCAEIQDKQQPLLLLRHKPAENLLATFLFDISNRLKSRGLSPVEFDLPMARCDIASHLGLAGETMSRLFTRFQKMDLLSTKGRTVNIKNLDALQAMSVTIN